MADYMFPKFSPGLLSITQSGETKDLIDAIQIAHDKKIFVLTLSTELNQE